MVGLKALPIRPAKAGWEGRSGARPGPLLTRLLGANRSQTSTTRHANGSCVRACTHFHLHDDLCVSATAASIPSVSPFPSIFSRVINVNCPSRLIKTLWLGGEEERTFRAEKAKQRRKAGEPALLRPHFTSLHFPSACFRGAKSGPDRGNGHGERVEEQHQIVSPALFRPLYSRWPARPPAPAPASSTSECRARFASSRARRFMGSYD